MNIHLISSDGLSISNHKLTNLSSHRSMDVRGRLIGRYAKGRDRGTRSDRERGRWRRYGRMGMEYGSMRKYYGRRVSQKYCVSRLIRYHTSLLLVRGVYLVAQKPRTNWHQFRRIRGSSGEGGSTAVRDVELRRGF